ncbi:hypothetical protein D8M04_00480 [Oceanobacillus piezotolerans]|uniref:DUF3967 domain-containing protein n=1 Tax=Oceanobacillus piezotolerans TaxID=2448030 RepID=A0A498D9Z7_9BACI|nr:helix-turn-helix domain-containing protein [Oceanobacillus piezotolerans]RLL47791.1 hypothetical protein D8M04_00480 [Oceanobacillus piezotolerans]
MEKDIEISEKAYTTSEIATMLDMGVTTVRKYAQYLEKSGYNFVKTKHNARLYVEHDIMAIRYLKELRDKTNITVEQATSLVMKKIGNSNKTTAEDTSSVITSNTPSVEEERYTKQYEQLTELMIQQKQLIQCLIDRLDKQQEAFDERLNERDKDLMRIINEKLEAQKQIAAAEEKSKELEQKPFFSRLFKRA